MPGQHPDPQILERFMRNEAGAPERRVVILHLLTGCAQCVAVTRRLWSLADAPPELVTDGMDGFLEPVGDIAAQAGRVTQLLTSEDLYRGMATAPRQTAVERFASSTIIPQYEQYYREVVERAAQTES